MKELGQLFITGIDGHYLRDQEAEFISKENIGGVILFDRNFESLGQVGELVNSIQELNKAKTSFYRP
jgi:beta-N-acetylhexosaminidase